MIRHTSAAPAAAVANPRNVRRQYLTSHLCKCGPRCVLEALIAVEAGQDLDFVLADFARLAPQTYRSIGADRLPFKTGLSDDFLAGRYGKVREAATGAIT
jgi:hypothetical protein